MTTKTEVPLRWRSLAESDPEISKAIRNEVHRQNSGLELIASENFVSQAVLEAAGSVLTNKYAEGYPGKRYYGGCEFVDVAESLAIVRARELFGADHANVQPHSGAQANMAVYFTLLKPGDTVLGMNLAHGGHLTHGHPLNFSGKLYNIVPYGVRQEDERIDYDELERLAREHAPKMIMVGASAYPRIIDFERIGAIGKGVGVPIVTDMAHIAGLVAAKVHPSPVPHSDFVTTTTHKTLRGPRGGMVLCRAPYAKDLDRALFPGVQGGPLMHIIAAKAVCFKEATEPGFVDYQRQIVANAQRLARGLSDAGFRLVSGGTDNHLMLVDVFSKGLTGKVAEAALGKAGITVNKNAIPFDTNPPMVASGIRIGTPAVTSRGMREPEMDAIAGLIARGRERARVRAGRSRGPVPEVPALPGNDLAGVPSAAQLRAAVETAFAPGGPIPCALPGFEAREGQLQMAAAVCDVFADGGVLLAEAGTGTGKTLAYLIPAIFSRQRVLISTGTKNLQEQIFFKDLPVLEESLGVPFKATYMKGRGNYLCLHRFDAYKEGGSAQSLGFTRDESIYVRLIDEWRRDTQTGDRAELEDLPEDLPFWKDIAASSENCIGAECPQYNECFVTRMRQRAAESDLVIVNHHLLCADAAVRQSDYGEVIPECRYAVLDEAHQLEDVATQYFGIAVSNYRLDDLARDVERAIGTGQIADRDRADAIRDAAERVRDDARLFFGAVQMMRFDGPGVGGAESRVRIRPSQLERVIDEGASLVRAVDALQAEIALSRDLPVDVLAIGTRAGELRNDLAFILQAEDQAYVYYLEVRGRGVFLRASPIDVSNIVRELLLDRMKTTVLTSATLTVDGSFEYVRGRLGIRDAHEVLLRSEFDYRRQSILYLPKRMPDPRSGEFGSAVARAVVDIVKRTRGRAFVLFTSYANLREVQARAAAEIEYPILVQGSAPRSALLREFKATPNAVLLATSSFWQGVDVVGEALSCVIIDKLPFASPGDPITAARIEAINARGGSAFGEYQIPLAILALQQGLGRLLRHRQDRGVLAVLDPRLRSMGYGRRFLASLPPAPVTSQLGDIERFFEFDPDPNVVSTDEQDDSL